MGAHRFSGAAIAAVALLGTFNWAVAPAASNNGPRLSDGRPDLNGTWDNGSGIDFVNPQKQADGSICIAGCEPAAGAPRVGVRVTPDRPKYKPEFAAKVKELEKNQVREDP